ncbi:MAG: helix-turn-helix domain-containing protein, partial [Campylobacterota bacterium]|nr:helix-turn-helix domain-containing protein [Campylobacterota bacterium]
QIELPKFETKIKIIKKKCEINGITLDDEIVNFIASSFNNSMREIEGVLVNIEAHSTFLHKKIDLALVKDILKEQLGQKEKEITISKIIELVAKELNIKPSDIKSKRTAPAVKAKRVIIYLAKELVSNTSLEIANELGMKTHSTISKAMKKIDELIDTDKDFRLLVENLKNKLIS